MGDEKLDDGRVGDTNRDEGEREDGRRWRGEEGDGDAAVGLDSSVICLLVGDAATLR